MEDDIEYGDKENRMSEIPAVMDFYRKFTYGIIASTYKFCDVYQLYSLICITYHAAHWMLTGVNVHIYQGSSRTKRGVNFNLKTEFITTWDEVNI